MDSVIEFLNENEVKEIVEKLIEENLYFREFDGIIMNWQRVDIERSGNRTYYKPNTIGDHVYGYMFNSKIPSQNGELFETGRVMNSLDFGNHLQLIVESRVNGETRTYILYNN